MKTIKEQLKPFVGRLGIYAIRSKNKIVYVGKSTNIGYRLWQHFKKRKRKCLEFSVWDLTAELKNFNPFQTSQILNHWEALEIERLNPSENIKRPFVDHPCQCGYDFDVQKYFVSKIPSFLK